MPLKELILLWTGISDIRPLQGMPLKLLNLEGTKVADITVLSGMPLRRLQLGRTKVRDVAMLAEFTALETLTIPDDAINVDALRHLTNLKLIGYHFQRLSSPADFWAEYEAQNNPQMRDRIAQVRASVPDGKVSVTAAWGLKLDFYNTDIRDLTPVRPLPVSSLILTKSKVPDLAPLRGMRLRHITFDETAVADVSPLLDLPILEAALVPQRAANLEVLRHHPTLQYLGWEGDWDADARPKLTTAQFWQRYDALKAAGPK